MYINSKISYKYTFLTHKQMHSASEIQCLLSLVSYILPCNITSTHFGTVNFPKNIYNSVDKLFQKNKITFDLFNFLSLKFFFFNFIIWAIYLQWQYPRGTKMYNYFCFYLYFLPK